MDNSYAEVDKTSDKVKVGDVIVMAGMHCEVLRIRTNDKNGKVFDLKITQQSIKKYSEAIFIVPKKNILKVLVKSRT